MTAARGDLGRFMQQSAVYAAGNAINRVGAFVLLPVYTRFLSVAQYGQIELFYVISSIAGGLLSIGIAHATLRFYYEHKDPREQSAVVSTNLIASFVITASGVGLLGLWAPEIALLLFGDAALAPGVWLVLATLVLELSSQVGLAYLRARERAVLFVAISIGKLLVQVSVNTVMLAVLDAGVIGVLVGNLVTVAVGWVVLVGFTLGQCGVQFSWAKLLPVLKYGYPFLLSTMVGLAAANVDRFLITGLLSLQALGLYALASKFASLLTELVGEPFNQAYGAFRFTIMGKDGAAEIQARIVRYLLIASGLAALALSYFVDALLLVLATPAYHEAALYVPLLAMAAVARVLAYPLQTGILYQKQTRHIFHIGVIVAVVNAAGGYLLISWLGLIGACLTVLLSGVVTIVLTNHFSQRYFPVRYEHARLAGVAALIIAFQLAAIPLPALGFWFAGAIKMLLLALFVAAVVKLGGIEPEELAQARQFLAGRWRSLASKKN